MGLKELEFKNDLDMLFQAILELENIDECYKFFEDIATITELKSISQRIQVAKMLREKRVYTEATISRVNKCLNYGQGGYDIVLDRINSKDK